MMSKLSLLAGAATLALGLATTAGDALAESSSDDYYSYAVKFVCGQEKDGWSRKDYAPVVKGTYATAINIYNPNEFKVRVELGAYSTRHDGTRSLGSSKYEWSYVEKIDCYDLFEEYRISHDELLKGVLYIKTPHRLDVTAVYTSGDYDYGGATIDVEQVFGRKIDGKGRAAKLAD
jgi:hypothetical protein